MAGLIADCVSKSAANAIIPRIVDGVTTSTLNSPVYFVLTGLPTLFASGDTAFYLMRVVSALICSLLLAIASFVLGNRNRKGA